MLLVLLCTTNRIGNGAMIGSGAGDGRMATFARYARSSSSRPHTLLDMPGVEGGMVPSLTMEDLPLSGSNNMAVRRQLNGVCRGNHQWHAGTPEERHQVASPPGDFGGFGNRETTAPSEGSPASKQHSCFNLDVSGAMVPAQSVWSLFFFPEFCSLILI